MIEGGGRSDIMTTLTDAGYRYAVHDDGPVLRLAPEGVWTVNAFFIHESRIDEYMRGGLLRPTPEAAT